MKRFHVHAHVENLEASIAFYSKMFAVAPTRVESDYAKWMLDDPRINFAISTRGSKPGVDHLGIQTDTEDELVAGFRFLYTRAKVACELAGAATTAALLAGRIELEPGSTVVAVISGGNIVPETAAAILAAR